MKTKKMKLVYNIVVGALLLGGITWVSLKFIHFGR